MGDYTRRVRFAMAADPNQLVMHVATFGELNISMPHQLTAQQQQGPGLMRSKSDHRLAAQYRHQEDRLVLLVLFNNQYYIAFLGAQNSILRESGLTKLRTTRKSA